MVKDLDVPPEDYPSEGATEAEIKLQSLRRCLKYPCSTMEDAPLESALFSLQIVIGHLIVSGVDLKLLAPLSTLVYALEDHVDCIKSPLLEFPRDKNDEAKPGGKRTRTADARNMATAAAAITLSGRRNMKKTCQRAARKLGINELKLNKYRRNLMYKNRIKNLTANYYYSSYIQDNLHLSMEIRRVLIERMINGLSPIRSV